MAQKVFQIGDAVQQEYFSKIFINNDFSQRLYRENDLNAIYDEFAMKYKRFTDRESGFAIFQARFKDENGEEFVGYQKGKLLMKKKYGRQGGGDLPIWDSKIIGGGRIGDWKIHSAIHTHPNSTSFSGLDTRPGGGPRTDFLMMNDLGWSIKNGAKVLLTNPDSDYIQMFDPRLYQKNMNESGENQYDLYVKKRQAKRSISKIDCLHFVPLGLREGSQGPQGQAPPGARAGPPWCPGLGPQ